jgi:CubicO group peptidase (beta-lactamase class C family)
VKRAILLLLPVLAGCVTHPASDGCVIRTFVNPPAQYARAAAEARSEICERLMPVVPGAQIAVAVNGRLIWSAGFGYADRERNVPVSEETMFRVGSIAKPITGDAFVLLVQQGKLDPDAPVQRYVPSFPTKPWPITPRELAGHLSGIRHYKDDEFLSARHYRSVDAALSLFENDPLLFEPGTRFGYSTYGYTLLSAVLESAAGEEFPRLMQELVLDPLRLTHTALEFAGRTITPRAQPYDASERGFTLSPQVDNSDKWAGGGIVSTADDLVAFGSAHLAPGRLTSASLELLFTSMKTVDGKETAYGVGWDVGVDAHGRRVVRQTGSAEGGTARIRINRDSGVVEALCVNVTQGKLLHDPLQTVWDDITAIFDP